MLLYLLNACRAAGIAEAVTCCNAISKLIWRQTSERKIDQTWRRTRLEARRQTKIKEQEGQKELPRM